MTNSPQSPPTVSPQMAAKTILNRRKARQSLIEFARACGYEPAAHHRLIIEKLEAVARGDIERLMIFAPPGSAKSSYASMLFPAWYLGQHPGHAVIAASHTQELAERFGRRVRNLVAEHSKILNVSLSADNAAAGRWSTVAGGEYFSAGVGGSITGRRADLVVIDDPIRSFEDASSELIRNRHWDWFSTDLRTRLKPGARVVLIQTRWHEDDLAGHLLADMQTGGEQWHVVNLPAEAEEDDPLGRQPGELLWDDAYGYGSVLRREKASQPPRNWSALFQQRPAPEEGDYFKSEWLKPYDIAPPIETLRTYLGADFAVTSGGGDFTVIVVVGLDPEGRMYLLDLWRKQAASDVWVEATCDMIQQWRPLALATEVGQIKSGVGPFLERRMRERGAFAYIEKFPTRHDKAVRAQSIRGRMALGSLYVPQRAPWLANLRSELLAFPAGKHDDIVDALGLVGQLLDRMVPGRAAVQPADPGNIVVTASGQRFRRVQQKAPTIDEWWERKHRHHNRIRI